MSKKREYKPAGVKARITMNFWFPGITTCIEARRILERVLKLQLGEGDWFVELGEAEESYRLVEERAAEKQGLPKRPTPGAGGAA